MKSALLAGVKEHVIRNKTIYIALLILYILTLIGGTFCISFLNESDLKGLHEFFDNFIEVYQNNKIDFWELFWASYLNNLKYLFIIFISGFIVIGMPFIVVILGCKVFYISFALGSIFKLYGFSGLPIGFSSVFLQNFLTIPLFLIFAVHSIRFSLNLFQMIRKRPVSPALKTKGTFEEHTVAFLLKFVLFALLLALFNLIEAFFVIIFA